MNCTDVEIYDPVIDDLRIPAPRIFQINNREHDVIEQYIGSNTLFNETEIDLILVLYANYSFNMGLFACGDVTREPQKTLVGDWNKDENQLKLITIDNEIIYRQIYEDKTIAGKSLKLETYVFETCKKDFFASNLDLVKRQKLWK
jgi:hypothetical protein